jgi:UDP-glucuronate decarboxylase
MHPNDGRVVSNFIVQALRNSDITVYGDGMQTRSFCYVDDLVEGLIRLMETGDGVVGPVNLGNPEEFTIRQMAEIVANIAPLRKSFTARFPLTIPNSVSRTSAKRRSCLVGGRRSRYGLG